MGKVDRLVAELEREKVRSGELERLVERKEEEVHALRAEVKSRAVDDRRCTELREGQMRQERSASVHSPAVFLQMVRSHEPKAWPQYKADLELEVYKLQSDADTMCQTLDNLSRGQR